VSSSPNSPDYSGVTETPGTLVSREAISMGLSRYEIVRRLAAGQRVLEVACGSGQGLGYVGRDAEFIVGGDITSQLLDAARAHYKGTVPLVQFDAHQLPFAESSFDIIQIHEAIYYMARPDRVFEECRRVLSADGILVVSSINPEWADFNPSAYAAGYFNATELNTALLRAFRFVEMSFGFRVPSRTLSGVAFSALKRAAVRLKLIPKTMSGKTMLKRIFLGRLQPVPVEFTRECAPIDVPQATNPEEATKFRIIYAVARR
jgi:SAM-dependent methyltransferase